MPTVAVKIRLDEAFQEFLIAELADLDFESFEQDEDRLTAYIPAARWDDVKREYIETWLAGQRRPVLVEEELIDDRNWNRQWEETIGHVAIEPFLVKPTWRDVPEQYQDLILLEIDPKMSFGTGYHESTRLVLRMLPGVVTERARVLDAGTGTGILAIAAVKLGASSVDAFDIDPWAQQNALENFYLNGVQESVRMVEGGIERVPRREVDVVLANMNLIAIEGLLSEFHHRLRAGGLLVTSGILLTDRDRLVTRASGEHFKVEEEVEEGDWWAAVFVRA